MTKICCIAIIGKQNNPLYIKNFQPELYEDLKFHYIAHTSCDLFQERSSANKSIEQYYGLLHIVEDFVVYGYMTNTSIKFIIVLELGDEIIKDVVMKRIFRDIHGAYIMLKSESSFISPAEISCSKQFSIIVDKIGQSGV